MDAKFDLVTLDNLGGGMACELFAIELRRVLEDIDDPNSDPKTKRRITREFIFEPTQDRSFANITIVAKTKLAGFQPQGVGIHIGRRDKRLVALAVDSRQEPIPFPNRPKLVPQEETD